ncbi:hypothetical protein [Neptuniibacter sp. QD37_11]|uniref:hypothetical protein n=1 Tax=Neptuniibacter sp. QD37_11 TaxID=3398209 RepID=UPI0039F459E6
MTGNSIDSGVESRSTTNKIICYSAYSIWLISTLVWVLLYQFSMQPSYLVVMIVAAGIGTFATALCASDVSRILHNRFGRNENTASWQYKLSIISLFFIAVMAIPSLYATIAFATIGKYLS